MPTPDILRLAAISAVSVLFTTPLLIAVDQASGPFDAETVVSLLELVIEADEQSARECLDVLKQKIQSRELSEAQSQAIRQRLQKTLGAIIAEGDKHPLYLDAAFLAASWGHPPAIAAVQRLLVTRTAPPTRRIAALQALVSVREPGLPEVVASILATPEKSSASFRGEVLTSLGRLDDPQISAVVLSNYGQLEPDLRPKAIELLTQRAAWSKALLAAIGDGRLPADALNVTQVSKLAASPDRELARLVAAKWGSVRTERNPDRERVIDQMRAFLRRSTGDAQRGVAVFQNVCGQCHKIYGQGHDVGPEITRNGRSSFEQLLSNVFDPSLVIGASYQARTVLTADGRVLTGLLVEDSEQRLVLKSQGGKLETVARADVDELRVSPLSLMPEGLEKQLKPQELADLFAFLTLDRPPGDPQAALIPGVHDLDPRRFYVPRTVDNLLVAAKASSNTASFGEGRRGGPRQMIFDSRNGKFVVSSQWREDGAPYQRNLGVVPEQQPVWWMAEWPQPVEANLIALSGSYSNQAQPRTAWKIEVRASGRWTLIDRGVGGWFDAGRYLWGGAGYQSRPFDALRVSVFSSDDRTPLRSIHFRGEPGVSWIVARVQPADLLELPFLPRSSSDPKDFASLIAHVAPGFRLDGAGEGGVALLPDHLGRSPVVRTHPIDKQRPSSLRRTLQLPPQGARLQLAVSHHSAGDWRLQVLANGKPLLDQMIGPQTCVGGWAEFSLDLTPLAGQSVRLELRNAANGWLNEFAYWGRVSIEEN